MLKLPFIDRIWTARGSVEMDPPRRPDEAFARLDPLLKANGTEYDIDGDTLTYSKENPAAQDKLATFTKGTLQVVQEGSRSRLSYTLTSPALLLVFLAPLFFLAIAEATIFIVEMERPTAEEKAAAEAKLEESKEEEEEPPELNVIDQWLGAPVPETLEEKKQQELEEEIEDAEEEERHSPTPAYVFAGLFFTLFLVGRWLEPFLIRRRFRKALNGTLEAEDAAPGDEAALRPPG